MASKDCRSAPASTLEDALAPERWRQVRGLLDLPDRVSSRLLAQAFTHASFAREAGMSASDSNQRLEFLGDAVLDLILVEHLFAAHPEVHEGVLTKMKATAARSQTLARIARHMGLGAHLLLGRGEEETGGRHKASLLADCFEAVVGAVYLSTDLATTRRFVLACFDNVLRDIEAQQDIFDYKTALQELMQEHTKKTPSYHTVATTGPPHERTFVVQVRFNSMVMGQGQGSSKQAAQQAAARDAYEHRDAWLPQIMSR